jgi:hypothetical protein
MSEGGQPYEKPLGSCNSDTKDTLAEAGGAAAAAAGTVGLRGVAPSDVAEPFTAGLDCGCGGDGGMERAAVDAVGAAGGLQWSL